MSFKTISRRTMLRGAGGVTLGLPFLDVMQRKAHAAGEPLRFVVFTNGQGTMKQPDRWTPTGVGTDFTLNQSLKPLEPFKSKINVLSGIDNEIVKQWGTVVKQVFDPHAAANVSVLTAQPMLPGNALAGVQAPAAGPSIDYVVGSRNKGGKMSNLSLGGNGWQYSAPGVKVGAYDHLKAWKLLTSPPATTGVAKSRTPILDAVKGQAKKLMDQSLGSDDKDRFGAYLARIEELEKSIAAANGSGPPPAACVKVPQPASTSSPNARFEAQIKNAVMALSCDYTRVVTIGISSDPDWAHLRTDFQGKDWHAKVHEHGTPNLVEQMAVGYQWYGTLFASLLQQLEAVKEGSGTLLDNCLCLWISEFGDGGNHSTTELPIVLAGGLGGKLKTGRHLNFKGRAHNDLYTTILNLFGGDDQKFGFDGPGFNKGPLPLT